MADARPPAAPFYLVGMAVPAVLSLGLYRTVRGLLQRAKARHLARHPEACRRWQVFSREFLARPLVVPLLLTSAPRWNTHAIIGAFGPVTVRRKLAFHVAAARRSADWYFVVYRHGTHETVGSISHLNDSGAEWQEFIVPTPGEYTVGARYYRAAASVEFPAVQVDDSPLIETQLATETGNCHEQLAARDCWFFRALAFHVWYLLRCRRHLPETWLRKAFLPVGNPETTFVYGHFRRDQPFVLPAAPDAPADCDRFLTLYSRASLPVSWRTLDATSAREPLTVPYDGFFLVRLLPRRQTSERRGPDGGDRALAAPTHHSRAN